MSTTLDGATALASTSRLVGAMENEMMVGPFLPLQERAWSPLSAPRVTSWTYEYSGRCTHEAEPYGFDLAFGLGRWLGKGGDGGVANFQEHEFDPLISSATLAAETSKLLISALHVLYGWHAVHLVKFGACIDHINGGWWGLNVVTGCDGMQVTVFDLLADLWRFEQVVPQVVQAGLRKGAE
jgi:FMNH2-dependent dimethyl sulfone monooxygenase